MLEQGIIASALGTLPLYWVFVWAAVELYAFWGNAGTAGKTVFSITWVDTGVWGTTSVTDLVNSKTSARSVAKMQDMTMARQMMSDSVAAWEAAV